MERIIIRDNTLTLKVMKQSQQTLFLMLSFWTTFFIYTGAGLTRGSGLCGSPVEVVACQWWEERASTWSGWSTQREASASQSVGVAKQEAAHDLSFSLSRVKFTMFSAIAPLLTLAQLSESLPCLGKNPS